MRKFVTFLTPAAIILANSLCIYAQTTYSQDSVQTRESVCRFIESKENSVANDTKIFLGGKNSIYMLVFRNTYWNQDEVKFFMRDYESKISAAGFQILVFALPAKPDTPKSELMQVGAKKVFVYHKVQIY